MADEKVPLTEAIKRSIHAFVSARSTFAVHYVDPQLDAMAAQLRQDIDAFGYGFIDKDTKKPVELTDA